MSPRDPQQLYEEIYKLDQADRHTNVSSECKKRGVKPQAYFNWRTRTKKAGSKRTVKVKVEHTKANGNGNGHDTVLVAIPIEAIVDAFGHKTPVQIPRELVVASLSAEDKDRVYSALGRIVVESPVNEKDSPRSSPKPFTFTGRALRQND